MRRPDPPQRSLMTKSNPKDSSDLGAWVRRALREHARKIAVDPLTNSVWAVARELFHRLEQGQVSVAEIAAGVRHIHLDLLMRRGDKFRAQHALLGSPDPWAHARVSLESLAGDGWDAFQAGASQGCGGIVLTAHPTFALPRELRVALAQFVTRPDLASRDTLAAALDGAAERTPITLLDEHAEAQAALAHARSTLREFAELIFDTARTAFPKQWTRLAPSLPTLATWVGYDLDGRTDISWRQSLALRVREKACQFEYYLKRLQNAKISHGATVDLDGLISSLGKAATSSLEEAQAFAKNLEEPEALIAAVERLTRPDPNRIVDASVLTVALADLATSNGVGAGLARDLLVLKAEIETSSLGVARIHLRLNAAQIQTAIGRDLGLNTEDHALGRIAIAQLARMSSAPADAQVEFIDLHREQSTARRQLMLCALILRHVDARSPIRFLIAEAENPATVMGALYLARRYGVEHALDISPLFETPDAMDRGGRFMERLLDEPVFLDYLGRRGRLCIQFGFSDSGRFVGQLAADMAIERLHNLICRAMASRGLRLPLVIFNTHGESMGRGGFPGSFEQRLRHLLTPWTRAQFAAGGIAIEHETSFQGGDGFMHLASESLARATLAAQIAHHMPARTEASESVEDRFYEQADLVWDFYRAMRSWHEALCADPDYAVLLNSFAASFLAPAGSRPTKRPDASAGPRGMRAIPHNGLLQQLAAPLNVACGVGASAAPETDRLIALANGSSRFKTLLELAVRARLLTSVPVLRGYASVYSPDVWIALSKAAPEARAPSYESVAAQFRDYSIFTAIQRIANRVALDLSGFDRMIASVEGTPSPSERHEQRLDIHILHVIRQALMMRAMAVVVRTPPFSDRHDASFDDLFDLVAQMRLGEASRLLGEIFPGGEDDDPMASVWLGEGGRSTQGPRTHGYHEVRRDIIGEIDKVATIMTQVSLALCSPYGAAG